MARRSGCWRSGAARTLVAMGAVALLASAARAESVPFDAADADGGDGGGAASEVVAGDVGPGPADVVAGPECATDADCGPDQVCGAGVCVTQLPSADCTADADCPTGQLCTPWGLCDAAKGWCHSAAECDEYSVCDFAFADGGGGGFAPPARADADGGSSVPMRMDAGGGVDLPSPPDVPARPALGVCVVAPDQVPASATCTGLCEKIAPCFDGGAGAAVDPEPCTLSCGYASAVGFGAPFEALAQCVAPLDQCDAIEGTCAAEIKALDGIDDDLPSQLPPLGQSGTGTEGRDAGSAGGGADAVGTFQDAAGSGGDGAPAADVGVGGQGAGEANDDGGCNLAAGAGPSGVRLALIALFGLIAGLWGGPRRRS